MDKKSELANSESAVFAMLDKLKSNGQFDEFRRKCVTDIDAKPTYQNWKQRIESYVNKFLSKFKYTPELNKNTVRERLRKHLLDGREALDIEEGADRILTQVLAPRMLSTFESEITKAVNEYLGIKNETFPIEQNGIKESNKNVKNIFDVGVNINVSNPNLDTTSDADNIENIDETSPEFEPLSSVLDNDDSNDDSVSGMSDLASVGSPIQLISKENHDANSNCFESDKNSIEKPQQTLSDVNGISNHKNDSIKPDNVPKIINNTEKLKANDSKSSKSKHSSKTSLHNTQEKSSSRSKDRNSSNHRSSSREKNDSKKRSSSSSKDRKNSNHSKHHSNSKDKKHRHDKKSHHSDHDKTPKRDRKDSRSDKKEKSSSLCKEPKSLNGNRSDDDSNAGGSSKQKNNLHKNKSSTSDKSKSSSSNHRSSRKDNSNKEVVDKSKDKSSISKNYNTPAQKSNQKDSKSHKRLRDKNKSATNDSNIEEKKQKWSDFRSCITNDEQDAANILLSISEIPFESSHDIQTENIMYVENSSPTKEASKISVSTTENELGFSESSNQTIIIQSDNNDNVKENVNLKTNNSETTQLVNSFDERCENVFKLNSSLDKSCSTDKERYSLPCKDVKLQNDTVKNVDIASEYHPTAELMIDKKEEKLLNGVVCFDSSDIQITSKRDINQFLKVPKLKLKRLLPDDFIKKVKRKKHDESKIEILKPSKSYVLSSETNVPVIESASTSIVLENNNEQGSNSSTDIEMNEVVNTSDELLNKENKIKSTLVLDDIECPFIGFSQTDSVVCKNSEKLKDLIKSLQKEINIQNKIINDGFIGFSSKDLHPCENRHIVYSQLVKLKENLGFKGFTEKEVELRVAHKFVREQLELAKKENNNQQKMLSSGGNGVQNGKKLNEVMAILYKSDKDNTAVSDVYDKVNENSKKDCPGVNNNNHDITASDDWVVEQEMKYNLLPVKVKIERLLEYRCNSAKQVSNSSELPNAPQRSKFK